jgi:hypothetical protein
MLGQCLLFLPKISPLSHVCVCVCVCVCVYVCVCVCVCVLMSIGKESCMSKYTVDVNLGCLLHLTGGVKKNNFF